MSSSDSSSDDSSSDSSTSSSSSSSGVQIVGNYKIASKPAPKKVAPKGSPAPGFGILRVKSAVAPGGGKLPAQPNCVYKQKPRERKARIHNAIEAKRHKDLCTKPESLDIVKRQVAWVCNRHFGVRPGRVNTRELSRIVMRAAAYSPDDAAAEIFEFLSDVLEKVLNGSIAHGVGHSLSIFLLSAKLLVGLSLWLTRFLESTTLGKSEWMIRCLMIAKRVLTSSDKGVMTPELWGTFPMLVLKVIAVDKKAHPVGHSLLEMVVPWVGLKEVHVEVPASPMKPVDVATQLQNERKVMAERLQKTQNTNQEEMKSLPAIIVVDEADQQQTVTAAPPRHSLSHLRRAAAVPSSFPPFLATPPGVSRKFPISNKKVVSILNKETTGNRIVWDESVSDRFGPSKYRNQDSRRERETRNTDKVKLRIKLSEFAELEEDCLKRYPTEEGCWSGWRDASEVVPAPGPPLPGFRHQSYNYIHPSAWVGTLFNYLTSEIEAENRPVVPVVTHPPTTTLVKMAMPKPIMKKGDLNDPINLERDEPYVPQCIDLT